MVNAISNFDAGAFLNQVKGISKPAPAASGSSGSSSSSTSSSSTKQPDAVTLSQSLLTLLQGSSSSSSGSGGLSDIFGSVNTSDPLAGVYNTFRYNSSTKPLQDAIASAQQKLAQLKASSNNPQNALTSYHNNINAYNKTLLQNAQAVLKANNGVLPPIVG